MKKLVVCAWIARDWQILLSQRKKGGHLEDLWEFPGGKVEPGETHAGALARELREELGIDALIGDEIARVEHPYQDFTVELILLEVMSFAGEPRAADVAAVRWVAREWLQDNLAALPPADGPLVSAALRL